MKIVFLCGSLEPGRDGIGDYVRRIAGELLRQGHEVGAVALNDHHLPTLFQGEQDSESFHLPVLRLPSVLASETRFLLAKKWIDELNPDWISLQFVTFAFHPKGLPFRLGGLLKKLGEGRRWHFMFHELWVGMNIESAPKLIWWGRIQKWLIRSLLVRVKPAVIHTQTRMYLEQLARLGFKATFLPLFSNIPASYKAPNHSSNGKISPRDENISLVVFGSIHPGAPVEQLAKEAGIYSKKYDRKVVLKIIGRCGDEQDRWAAVWKSHGLEIELFGEQPAAKISEILANATMGISTSAFPLVEKSGAAAAMREHGIPVLCVASPWHPRVIASPIMPVDILKYSEGNFEDCLRKRIVFPPASTVSDVAYQLSNALLSFSAAEKRVAV